MSDETGEVRIIGADPERVVSATASTGSATTTTCLELVSVTSSEGRREVAESAERTRRKALILSDMRR